MTRHSKKRQRSRKHRPDPEARGRALEVLSLMRTEKLSLSRAARVAGTSPRTVIQYVGKALGKSNGRRYNAKPFDRLKRTLNFITESGVIAVDTRSSKTATRIAKYFAAVDRCLNDGNIEGLRAFEGESIVVGKIRYPFVTNLGILTRLGNAGVIEVEGIYAP